MRPLLRHEEPLGELVSRIVDDAKVYARAEVTLVKAIAQAKVAAIRPAAILIVCAIFLLQAALTVLVAALGMTLALWLGTAGGLAVGAVLVLLLAALLAWLALGKLKGIA